ncbi:MAG: hypothetical protein UR26_C0005G0008 [candidate division TM6 bacterium GW2011_GWF2_32_72]|nr:MAG: hypothetical protein UR26_C0005G0008 [candidate division TM6 bacterium GW2011_GWF2_32_72]
MFFDDENSDQVVLSYELLHLLRWLIENEQSTLKRLVKKSLKKGLTEAIMQAAKNRDDEKNPEIHYSITDFFGLMDDLLNEGLIEDASKQVLQQNLLSTIDQIDSSICDTSTLNQSLMQATSELEKNPHQNAKHALYKELLKTWKPFNSKKNIN